MRGVDTNVLVRYLTQDDPAQFAQAAELMNRLEAAGERVYINSVVLSELVWVLSGARYRFSRSAIAETIEQLLVIPLFELEDRDQVVAAVADYRDGSADFADYLIGRKNLGVGCERTATFDSHLAGLRAFEVLGS